MNSLLRISVRRTQTCPCDHSYRSRTENSYRNSQYLQNEKAPLWNLSRNLFQGHHTVTWNKYLYIYKMVSVQQQVNFTTR